MSLMRPAAGGESCFAGFFLAKICYNNKKHKKELSNLKEMKNDAKTIRTEAIQEVLPDQAVKGGRLAKACSDWQI